MEKATYPFLDQTQYQQIRPIILKIVITKPSPSIVIFSLRIILFIFGLAVPGEGQSTNLNLDPLSALSTEATESSDILRSSHSFLHCSQTVSRPCSSHFTEAPDVAEMTDEPVERRELDDATDTGWSDNPFEDATEAGQPVLILQHLVKDQD